MASFNASCAAFPASNLHDDEDLVLDARAALTPAEMVDAKFYALLDAVNMSAPQRDNRGSRSGRLGSLTDR